MKLYNSFCINKAARRVIPPSVQPPAAAREPLIIIIIKEMSIYLNWIKQEAKSFEQTNPFRTRTRQTKQTNKRSSFILTLAATPLYLYYQIINKYYLLLAAELFSQLSTCMNCNLQHSLLRSPYNFSCWVVVSLR